jgi:hypothetical protein
MRIVMIETAVIVVTIEIVKNVLRRILKWISVMIITVLTREMVGL